MCVCVCVRVCVCACVRVCVCACVRVYLALDAGPERPEAVLPDRALCLPTFGHFLIVNKTSLSLSLWIPKPRRSGYVIRADPRRSEPPCARQACHKAKRRVGYSTRRPMLEPVRPEAVLPDRALCLQLPTFSHFLIVNKTSLSLSSLLSLSLCCQSLLLQRNQKGLYHNAGGARGALRRRTPGPACCQHGCFN